MKNNISLYSVGQTREIEKYLIQAQKIPEFELMYEAGKAVFNIVQAKVTKEEDITVICGSGNNGGDGYVVAALAAKEGYKVTCLEVGEFSKQSSTSKKAKECALENKVVVSAYDKATILTDNSVIIDAILGIGIKGKVRAIQAEVIHKINNSGSYVIAIDNPSGLDSDTGDVLGISVIADITVTFLSHKQGLFLNYGTKCSGEVKFSNLRCDYEDFLKSMKPKYHILDQEKLSEIIPKRKLDAHKGDFGNILIIGGDYGMAGAIIMAAAATYKSGAGKVTVLSRESHMTSVVSNVPNAMFFAYEKDEDLQLAIQDKTLIVIGPGLGKSDWSKRLFNFFMECDVPKVIDADALNLLSESKRTYHLNHCVMTPHPKEAARLLGMSTDAIQENRQSAIEKLCDKYHAVTVLKGANSLILGDKKRLYLCPYSNPAMSVAGMGDILTGIIAGLSTQKIACEMAVVLGVYLHVLAANRVSDEMGEIGVSPSDLLENLGYSL